MTNEPRRQNGNLTLRSMLNMIILYAAALEFNFGRLFFDSNQDEPSLANPRGVTVEPDHSKFEECSAPGTTREISTEVNARTDGSCDRTDMDHYTALDAEMGSEQPDFKPTSPRSRISTTS